MADHFREIARHHIPDQVGTVVERILVDGPDAVVLGEIRQTARPTARAYHSRFALHLTIENNLIVRYHVYEDSLAVAEAFDTQNPEPDNPNRTAWYDDTAEAFDLCQRAIGTRPIPVIILEPRRPACGRLQPLGRKLLVCNKSHDRQPVVASAVREMYTIRSTRYCARTAG